MAHLVIILAGDFLPTPAVVVIASKFNNIWHEVVALDHQVLDDYVGHSILHFDTRNRNIANIFEDGGKDNVSEVLDKVFLELDVATLIATQVGEQFLHGITESLVLAILVELVTKELDLVENTIGVVLVTVTQQESAMVNQFIILAVPGILQHVALLLQSFTMGRPLECATTTGQVVADELTE